MDKEKTLKSAELLESLNNLSPQKRALLAMRLRAAKKDSGLQDTIPRATLRDQSNSFPLGFAQERLWFMEQLMPGNAIYNNPGSMRILGPLDSDALEKTFNELADRHESLRTIFISESGEPRQVVLPAMDIDLETYDLSDVPADEREREAQQLVKLQSWKPFDLKKGPLIRPVLVRLAEQEHVLLVVMHHIICDGWSLGVIIRELVALYDSFSNKRPSPLSPLPIQYADFAIWQRDWLRGEVLQTQFDFWKSKLGDNPPILDLPTDKPRPLARSFQGLTRELYLDKPLIESLREVAHQQEVTLFMLLLAAFKVLMFRYSGQRDIIVGSPYAGRERTEIEGLIGLFVNTLALRTNLSFDLSFCDYLRQVRDVTLSAYAHGSLPFDKLVGKLQPERDPSRQPLYQVLFALQNMPMQRMKLQSQTIIPFQNNTRSQTLDDLNLSLIEYDQGIFGILEYNTDIFCPTTIEKMLCHYQTLLESIIENPDQSVSGLNLLREDERKQIIEAWNETSYSYEQSRCAHHLFEEQAQRTPDAVSVVFEDAQITYNELNVRANLLAHYLISLGVEADSRVGICCQRSIEMVVAVIGILKAGGAYLPLDPSYPHQRLEYMLADASVEILLSTELMADVFATKDLRTICLDADWDEIATHSSTNPVSFLTEDNLGYVIYTSGSTGNPKGVALSHRALVNLIEWNRATLPVRASILQFSSLSFDASFHEIFSALATGAAVWVISEAGRVDILNLGRYLIEKDIERVNLPVVALQNLAEVFAQQHKLSGTLKEVITTGEQLQITTPIKKLFGVLEDTVLHNHYGPSETHVVTAYTLDREPHNWPSHPSIGAPIFNTQIYVVDQLLNPVPVRVTGELYIGGVSLARGYLNRPDLTADRFIPDPLGRTPGERLYKAGDLARYQHDGNIEFLGRMDHQVKIRGYRIEPGEIEAILTTHPSISSAIVKAHDDEHGSKRLVAYLIHAKSEAPSTSQLRRHLKDKLPEYMIPSVFVFLDKFPLTPSGKVDHKALPKPDRARPDMEQDMIAPRTTVEKILAEIWAEVLGVGSVGINDNFLELGGDSISSIRVISRINRHGLGLTVNQLWKHQTISKLAEVASTATIDKDGGRLASEKELSVDAAAGFDLLALSNLLKSPERIEYAYRLSPMQQGILFHSLFKPLLGEYVEQFDCRLSEPFNLSAFRQAWEFVLARQPSLRTGFAWEHLDEPLQIVFDKAQLPMEEHDWREFSADEKQRMLEAFLQKEQTEGDFNLSKQPLMKLFLFRFSDHDYRFVWSFHDIVLDGWSSNVVLQEVGKVYGALCKEELPDLAKPPDFRSYIEWLTCQDRSQSQKYWSKALEGFAAPTQLGLSRVVTDTSAGEAAYGQARHYLSGETSELLFSLARRNHMTLSTIAQGAWGIVLMRYSNEDDVVFGNVVSGRPPGLAGVENMVGVLVNTLPARLRMSTNVGTGAWLGSVQREQIEAREHEFSSLIDIHNWSELPSGQRLFESILAFVNYPEIGESLWQDQNWSMQKTGFPLFVLVRPGLRTLLEITYNSSAYDEETINRLLGHFASVLEAISQRFDAPVTAITLLSEAEQHQVLLEWNNTEREFPLNSLFVREFEAQVLRNPDAIAVRFRNDSLTYFELNRRAEMVAGALLCRGVGPDVIVGLLFNRGIEYLIAMIATMKARGAFLPLDPWHPSPRVAQIIGQSGIDVILTTREFLPAVERADEHLLPQRHISALVLEDLKAIPIAEENLPGDCSPQNLAYVIFTSGSTGMPKGAMIQHEGMLNHLCLKVRELNLSESDIVAQTASQCFDISVWQYLSVLLVGGCVQVFDDETTHDPRKLLAELNTAGVTVYQTVPSLMQLLLEEAAQSEAGYPALSAMRWLVPNGEALPPELCLDWFKLYPTIPIINAYGPTECSDDTTHHYIFHAPPADCSTIPIGKPLPNLQMYVVDKSHNLLPVTIAGQLYAGGVGVGRGYLNDPARTAEAYIPDPFSRKRGARLYKTGDLGRYLPGGELQYIGRLDYQVKIRGFRIELGEIESVLLRHPAVSQAAAIIRQDDEPDKKLIAYIVLHDEWKLSIDDLYSYLQDKLPDYMMPSSYVLLNEMPLTPNGKINRKALPEPDRKHKALAATFVAPSNALEESLANIWANVLKVDRVGMDDNFFKLGGHSLLATQVLARVQVAFDLELPLRTLFESPTIAELAIRVEEALLDEVESVETD